jgi:asparagine synthase (glutamine-hydrolysing)
MTLSLEHRGPDDSGIWSDPGAGIHLGFRRLAILDLSQAGHQPMTSSSGRYVITFNGEIYNFEELRKTLAGAGHRFRGHSDTEVLLAAFEQWGPERAVKRFQGMFAFALWDTAERRLWLARDRMGIKPLFLLESAEGIAFASEARAFHQCSLYRGRGDITSAWHFLQCLYVPGPRSILAGVTKVAPGEMVEFSMGQGTFRRRSIRYWDLAEVAVAGQAQPLRDESAAVEALAELLRDAVRLRLVADVPVGSLLSGGIDSTVVVALMQELSNKPVRTYTISFDDPDFDEGPHASAVAEHLGTDHTSVAFPSEEVLGYIPSLPGLSDEPMANPSLLPTLLVSRVARQEVVVALAGDGGDELFGGYNRYLHGGSLIRRMGRIPGGLRRVVAAALDSMADTSVPDLALRILRPSSVGRQHSASERVRKVTRMLRAGSALEAYAALLNVGLSEPPLRDPALSRGEEERQFCDRLIGLEAQMMLSDQLQYLPDDLLAKVDRASMWESLEVRVPILDHRVVAFSWTLPTSLKMRGGATKWPLRKIAEEYVPLRLLERPKMGFTVPIARWLQGELHDWARDTLSGGRTRASGIWDHAELDRLWSQFGAGRRDLALPLWTATVLQAWADAWNVSFQ